MLERTRKHHTEKQSEVRFAGDSDKISALKIYAQKLGLQDTTETVSLEVAMPETTWNRGGVCIRGGRTKENLTQMELSKLTGISQRHLSEMENGKRPIGKESAKRIAEVLKVDYRVFL